MPALTRRPSSSQASSCDTNSQRSNDSYDAHSTTPTSIHASPRPAGAKASRSSSNSGSYTSYTSKLRHQPSHGDYHEDISPGTSLYPRSSIDTYASTTASEEDLEAVERDTMDSSMEYEYNNIPALPIYRREVIEPNARPSTPPEFAKLFPSLNRFSIRHDEFTPDGNMNLRVDTVVTGRRRTAIQLFHLRMYDLAKREFSLRRYCRDSGREVCNAKRKYLEAPAPKPPKESENGRPTLQRSVTSAIKTLGGGNGKPGFRRTSSRGSIFGPKSPGSNVPKRPATSNSYSSCDDDYEYFDKATSSLSLADSRSGTKSKPQRPTPTNTIKLEFSNYARVDVHRRGSSKHKRYEFDWWGHRYAWKRSVDKQLGLVSFHLVRDGNGNAPVAHIVPEMRSPSQVLADETAAGWVPPCFMWIADESILDAMTDVADVIMATGLMALVDNCIKERWQTKKTHRIPVPLTSKSVDVAPLALMHQIFGRRNSNDHHYQSNTTSALRYAYPISAY